MLFYFSFLVFILYGENFLVASTSEYQGYKIYDVKAENEKEFELLHEFSNLNPDYDFFTLTRIPQRPSRVMVKPSQQNKFVEFLTLNGIKFDVINSNVGETLEKEKKSFYKKLLLNDSLGNDRYHSHEEINNYLESLAAKYPDRIFIETIGESYEKRPMKTIKITNGEGILNKNVIFIDGGFHAREWISPATVVYLIRQLAENPEKYAHLFWDFDWIILPVANPDGYEYTRSSPNRRLWRKTRSPNINSCFGTDPNRNFDFHWREEGASSNPCSETYAGSRPFSEIETQAVQKVLLSLKGRGKMYLTLHSYGSLLLYPWGWTKDLPDGWENIDKVCQVGQGTIKNATGTEYIVGSSANAIYVASGGSDDYAFAAAEFPISITMELPAGGNSGFDPPESEIDYSTKESWIGIRAMAELVCEMFPLFS